MEEEGGSVLVAQLEVMAEGRRASSGHDSSSDST